MRFKLFENGQEVNIIEADLRFVTKFCEENGLTFEEDELPLPAPVPTTPDRLASLESALAQTDETAIELYEANEEQQEINAAQDEALIEIYEMLEV